MFQSMVVTLTSTIRMARNAKLDKSGINFIGMGVSGGELGALHGPSLMPGGQKEAYDLVGFNPY